MNTSEASYESRRPQRLFAAAALAVLAIGAGSYATRSGPALAAPESDSPPDATTSMAQQSMQPRAASADADFGPGQCEPCVAGMQ